MATTGKVKTVTINYPRVTIIAATPLRNDYSNGIMMSSLFRGWPESRLHQIYFRQFVNHRPHTDVCRNFSVIDLRGSVETIAPAVSSAVACPAADLRQRWFRYLRQSPSLAKWTRFAQEMCQIQGWVASRLRTRLRQTCPDIVYALVGNYALARLVHDACSCLSLPLFMHVTDDYVEGSYQHAPLAFLRVASLKAFGEIVAYANGRAAVSPMMAEEYTWRHGDPWCWFTTLVDEHAYDPTPVRVPGRLHCVYAGNLGLGRWRPLQQLSQALALLRRERGIDARLIIYSSQDQLALCEKHLKSPEVEISGWAAAASLPGILHNADVLVHAESSQPDLVRYVRYSLSTKLSQYLMAGRCVLALGPADVGSISLVAALSAGVAVHDVHPGAIASALRQLCDPDWRAAAGRNGRNWALEWVERHRGHARFCQEIQASNEPVSALRQCAHQVHHALAPPRLIRGSA